VLKAVSLFTGIGGLDFGFEASGYQVKVAVDSNPVACKVLRQNRSWPVIERDIQDVSSQEIMDVANLDICFADI